MMSTPYEPRRPENDHEGAYSDRDRYPAHDSRDADATRTFETTNYDTTYEPVVEERRTVADTTTATTTTRDAHGPVTVDPDRVEVHSPLLDLGLLVLRIGTFVLILHGLHKLTGFDGFQGAVASNSFGSIAPMLFAVLVVAGQLLLPVALLVGFLTRLSGLLLAVMMLFISFVFTVPNAGFIDAQTGGLSFESSMWYWIVGIALFLTGPGRFSIDHALFGRRTRERKLARATR